MNALLLLSALLAAPAAGAQQEKLAPFVISKGVEPVMVDAVRQAMWKASGSVLGDAVIPEIVVRQKLKTPEKVVTKCGANLKCLAKVGGKLGAARILYARVVPAKAKAVQVQLLIIGVKSRLIEQRSIIELKSTDEARAKLVDQIYSMLSVNGPGHLEVAGGEADVQIDGKVVGKAPGVFDVSPGRHDVVVAGISASVLILPGGYEKLTINAAQAARPASEPTSQQTGTTQTLAPVIVLQQPSSQPGEGQTLVLVTDDGKGQKTATRVMLTPTGPVQRKRGTSWLLPTGAGVAGAGVVAIGFGVFFGLQSQSQRAEIVGGQTTQIAASELAAASNNSATTANILFGVGGGVAALGVALLVTDLILAQQMVDTLAVTPTLSPVAGGGAVGGIYGAF